MLRIKLVRSPIANTARQRSVVRALGLRRINQEIYREDNPSIRGAVRKVIHLVSVETVDGKPERAAPAKGPQITKQAAPKVPERAAAASKEKPAQESMAKKPTAKAKPKAESPKAAKAPKSKSAAKPKAKKAKK
jgi:large subunit ribosomal protein L30